MNKRTDPIVWKDKNLLHFQKQFKYKYTNYKSYCKVRYHSYYTGKYRGTAHILFDFDFIGSLAPLTKLDAQIWSNQ